MSSYLLRNEFYITDRGCNLHGTSDAIYLLMEKQAFPSVEYVIKHRDTIICLAELHDFRFDKKSQLSCDVDEYVKKLNKLIDDAQNKNKPQ